MKEDLEEEDSKDQFDVDSELKNHKVNDATFCPFSVLSLHELPLWRGGISHILADVTCS